MSEVETVGPLKLPSAELIRARLIACRTEIEELKKLLPIVVRIESTQEEVARAEKQS